MNSLVNFKTANPADGNADPQSARSIIAVAINTRALTALAESVTNDGLQALLSVLKKRDVPGGLGDSRAIREAFYAVVVSNIMSHAQELLSAAGRARIDRP